MVCPYCSADMEPIELNGKVFCSNCGLTVSNNAPASSAQNVINPEPAVVSEVATETPEEVPFLVIPNVAEEPADIIPEPENAPRKLEVVTEETPEPTMTMNPITEEAISDLGLTEITNEPLVEGITLPEPDAEPDTTQSEIKTTPPDFSIFPATGFKPITEEDDNKPEIIAEEPIPESKIAGLTIPSEEDFSLATTENNMITSSYIELENTGDEKATLEASGILLDILGEENKQNNYSSNDSEKLETDSSHDVQTINPVLEPEIPEKTETNEKDDDIYTLPVKIKTGFTNKKVKKDTQRHSEPSEKFKTTNPGNFVPTQDDLVIDPRTEKMIEKLEEKLENIPEPEVRLTPDEAEQYDPDTIDPENIEGAAMVQKSKIIKDYFSSAIDGDKKEHKKKKKKKKTKHALKLLIIFVLVILVIVGLSITGYYLYKNYKPTSSAQKAEETAKFTTIFPTYIPEGYIMTTSNYNDKDNVFEVRYTFTTDSSKTILYRQTKSSDVEKYISDYLLQKSANFTEKEVNGTKMTEVDKNNLLWGRDGFVFIIETSNFSLSNGLLYIMAESI